MSHIRPRAAVTSWPMLVDGVSLNDSRLTPRPPRLPFSRIMVQRIQLETPSNLLIYLFYPICVLGDVVD